MKTIIGIDASRNRSGGAKAHLIGILTDSDPVAHGIGEVHVWSYPALLQALPDKPWLIKHTHPALSRSMLHQLFWQRYRLPGEAARAGCQVLLDTDAGTVCRFRPCAVMSRDMLSYEPGEINRYGWSKARLRLLLLRYMQNASLRFADAPVFLTRYAAKVIQQSTGPLDNVAIIPHGVGEAFKQVRQLRPWPEEGNRPVECLYVSNAAPYKHQWHVVAAIARLRRQGLNVRLTLVGGGSGKAQQLLQAAIQEHDPELTFVTCVEQVKPQALPAYLAQADLFIFASSCENMPNTLIEAMAAGLPIACSDRGPMPEVLGNAGTFFDPEKPEDIALAIHRLITEPELRLYCAKHAVTLAQQYSWTRCGVETWTLLTSLATTRTR